MSILKYTLLFFLIFFHDISFGVEEYIYLNPFDGSKFFSVTENPSSVVLNDIEYKADFCDSSDSFICFESS